YGVAPALEHRSLDHLAESAGLVSTHQSERDRRFGYGCAPPSVSAFGRAGICRAVTRRGAGIRPGVFLEASAAITLGAVYQRATDSRERPRPRRRRPARRPDHS